MDAVSYLRFVLALAFVIGLMLAAAWAVRKFNLGHALPRSGRRLGVVETLTLDGRRRLVLVRRDDTEHLLLIGGGADVILERGIEARDRTPEREKTR